MTNEEMKRKAELFRDNKSVIHIDTLSGRFYNGTIINIGTDFILLKDRVIGDTFVLFSEVKTIEPYLDREMGDAGEEGK